MAHPALLAALTSNKSSGLTMSETWDGVSTMLPTCMLPPRLLAKFTHTQGPLESFSLEMPQIITWANLGERTREIKDKISENIISKQMEGFPTYGKTLSCTAESSAPLMLLKVKCRKLRAGTRTKMWPSCFPHCSVPVLNWICSQVIKCFGLVKDKWSCF